MTDPIALWVFGYGSIIWKPDMPYVAAYSACAKGWARRFWQGSHDHRGTPDAPGRVLTLVPMEGQRCDGRVFGIPEKEVDETLEQLDYREKNGYQRQQLLVETAELGRLEALTYIAPENNVAWLGDAPSRVIANQISHSFGPSGTNSDYVLSLHDALVAGNIGDEHVAEIAALLRKGVD